MRLALILVLAVGAAGCAVSKRELASDLAIPGVYLEGGGGFTKEYFDGSGFSDGYHGIASVGYRFNETLSTELDAQYHDGIDAPNPEIDGGQATINVKASVPLEVADPYAFVGAGAVYADVDYSGDFRRLSVTETEAILRGGIGVDVPMQDGWYFFAEAAYNSPRGDLDDFDYATFTVGFGFHFGALMRDRDVEPIRKTGRGRYQVNE